MDPCLECWNADVMSLDFLPGSLCWNTCGNLDVMGDFHSLTRFRGTHFSKIPPLQLVNLRTSCSCYAAATVACTRLVITRKKVWKIIVLMFYNNF